MSLKFYDNLVDDLLITIAKNGLDQQRKSSLSDAICQKILSSDENDLLALVHAAYRVRKEFFGNKITIHILNNVQNGSCPEDCHYCAQSKSSFAAIEAYPMKSDEEILTEAKNAYEKGAFRYCMVFSGKGPSDERIAHLVRLIRQIKSLYPMQVCVSAGVITEIQVRMLKDAGLDRMNHNLNTSRQHYSKICSTHSYQDRLDTIQSARKVGLSICSGVIIGMGESAADVLEMAKATAEYRIDSIPVNFYMPIEGLLLQDSRKLTPQYCLRVLCLFRFLNPRSEIRIAAGREMHLRGMEVLAFYVANSLFLDGYLNVRGAARLKTLQMIQDAGFTIESDKELEMLIAQEQKEESFEKINPCKIDRLELKTKEELRDLKS